MFSFLFSLLWFHDCHSSRVSHWDSAPKLERRRWVEEGPRASEGHGLLPPTWHCPQLGRSPWRWPTTLDSSSFAFRFLGTMALTFLPTHFCFLKDCVQELFCCFHFPLPIKVLKAGGAACLLLQTLCSLIWQNHHPVSLMGKECVWWEWGQGAGYFPI